MITSSLKIYSEVKIRSLMTKKQLLLKIIININNNNINNINNNNQHCFFLTAWYNLKENGGVHTDLSLLRVVRQTLVSLHNLLPALILRRLFCLLFF